MKIAILTSGILPVPSVRGGAAEFHMDSYLKYNDEHRLHDITIYSVADERTSGHPALTSDVNHYIYIPVSSLWAKIKKNLYHRLHGEQYYHYTIEYFFRQAWKLVQRQHYDIILLDNRPGYALSIQVPQATRLFIYLHNDLLNQDTKGARQIYNAASRIITVSDYISGRVRTVEPNDHKCVAVMNGIDLNAFSPRIAATISRQQLGFNEKDFVMVFSGRVTAVKGVRELITSMRQLRDYPDIKLLIIGSPFFGHSANEDDYVRMLKQEAREVEDRIHFTGFIDRQQMPRYLKVADIAVIPSLWDDPCPNTVLEAQAMGLPTITTRRGGIPEEVTPEGAMMLTTDENFQQRLTDAILDLYQHPEKRRLMAEAQLAHTSYYNEQRYVEEIFQAFEKPF